MLTFPFETVRQPPRLKSGKVPTSSIFPITPSSTSIQTLLRAAAQELSCAICFDILHDPVFLECRHGFCRGCITRMITNLEENDANKKSPHLSKDRQRCPLCKAPTQTRSLTSSTSLTSIIETITRISSLSGVDDISDTQQVLGVHSQAFALHYCNSSSGDVIEIPSPSSSHQQNASGGVAGWSGATTDAITLQLNLIPPISSQSHQLGNSSSSLIATRLAQSLAQNSINGYGVKRQRGEGDEGNTQKQNQEWENVEIGQRSEEAFTPIAVADTASQLPGTAVVAPAPARHITFQLSVSSSSIFPSGVPTPSTTSAANSLDNLQSPATSGASIGHIQASPALPSQQDSADDNATVPASIRTLSVSEAVATATHAETEKGGNTSQIVSKIGVSFSPATNSSSLPIINNSATITESANVAEVGQQITNSNVSEAQLFPSSHCSQQQTQYDSYGNEVQSLLGTPLIVNPPKFDLFADLFQTNGEDATTTTMSSSSPMFESQKTTLDQPSINAAQHAAGGGSNTSSSSSLVAPHHHIASSVNLTLTPPRWRRKDTSLLHHHHHLHGVDTDSDNSNSWGGGASSTSSSYHHPPIVARSAGLSLGNHPTVQLPPLLDPYPPPPPLPPLFSNSSSTAPSNKIHQDKGMLQEEEKNDNEQYHTTTSTGGVMATQRVGGMKANNTSSSSSRWEDQRSHVINNSGGEVELEGGNEDGSSGNNIAIPATQVLPPQHQLTSLRRNRRGNAEGSRGIEDSHHLDDHRFTGTCALCGLNTSDRAQMRKFLRSILSGDPSCCRTDIIGLSEQSARTLFGPLVNIDNEGGEQLQCHQLCLLWTPDITVTIQDEDDAESDEATTMDTVEHLTNRASTTYIGVPQSIRAAQQRRCGFCSEVGASYLPSASTSKGGGVGSSYFHIPCALLTGDDVCQVDSTAKGT